MTFEFIIIHRPKEDEAILDILRERLREALEANLNDVEADALDRMIRITFERAQPAHSDGKLRAVLGFSLDLPEATASMREMVDDFADALIADPIEHAVKCEDPLVRAELATRAEELFALEMKLRRVLSIIYLHAYPEANPYDLLAEETVQLMAKDKPQKEQMKAAVENQFFHLTFGQYVGLNQRPAIKDLLSLIRNEATYEAFRDELLRQPVEHEDDASFLAGLKERMDAIENLRGQRFTLYTSARPTTLRGQSLTFDIFRFPTRPLSTNLASFRTRPLILIRQSFAMMVSTGDYPSSAHPQRATPLFAIASPHP